MRQLAAVTIVWLAGCAGTTQYFASPELRKLDGYSKERSSRVLTSLSGDTVEITPDYRLTWHLPREVYWPWTRQDNHRVIGGQLAAATLQNNALVVTMSDGQSARLELSEVRRMEAAYEPTAVTRGSQTATAVLVPLGVIVTLGLVIGVPIYLFAD